MVGGMAEYLRREAVRRNAGWQASPSPAFPLGSPMQGWCHFHWGWAFFSVTLPGETRTNVCSPQMGAKQWFYLSWWSSEFIRVTFRDMGASKAADQEGYLAWVVAHRSHIPWSSLGVQLVRGSMCLHTIWTEPEDLMWCFLYLLPEFSDHIDCLQTSPHKHTGVPYQSSRWFWIYSSPCISENCFAHGCGAGKKGGTKLVLRHLGQDPGYCPLLLLPLQLNGTKWTLLTISPCFPILFFVSAVFPFFVYILKILDHFNQMVKGSSHLGGGITWSSI